MNQRPAVLLMFPAALVGISAVLLYATRGHRQSTTLLGEIHDAVEKNNARSTAIYYLMKKQRRALRALCDYILPVPKGAEKASS